MKGHFEGFIIKENIFTIFVSSHFPIIVCGEMLLAHQWSPGKVLSGLRMTAQPSTVPGGWEEIHHENTVFCCSVHRFYFVFSNRTVTQWGSNTADHQSHTHHYSLTFLCQFVPSWSVFCSVLPGLLWHARRSHVLIKNSFPLKCLFRSSKCLLGRKTEHSEHSFPRKKDSLMS